MGTVIANYTQLTGLFGGEAARWAGAAELTPEDEALLGRAVAALEDAESEAEEGTLGAASDVLIAPNDQAAALLQTYLAERALEAGKVEETRAGALEARFDSNDIGWVRAAIPYIRQKLGRYYSPGL